jgi:hypothetical protein
MSNISELPLAATVPADTVRADVARVLATAQVSRRITVSGHVYDTATGLPETVAAAARPGA